MVKVSCREVAATEDDGGALRPSQHIASVRRTLRRKTELSKLTEAE